MIYMEKSESEILFCQKKKGFPGGSAGKECASDLGDLGSIRGLRSPGEGNGYPLQYSGLENSLDCMGSHGVTWGHMESMGSQRVGHDWVTSTFTFMIYIYFYNISKILCILYYVFNIYLINAEYNKNWDASYILFSLNSFIVFSVVPVVLYAFSSYETRSIPVIGPKLACLSSLFLFLFFFFFMKKRTKLHPQTWH